MKQNIKYKMIFEAICNFNDLMDEETFKKDYKSNLLKVCKFMVKNDGLGWFDEEIKLVKAEFINPKSKKL